MDWLSGNPQLNLVFLILAIASVTVSILLYFKSKKSKDPIYLTKSYSIIDDYISAINGLEIKYQEHEIKRLTISKVAFWNGGRDTINRDDIAPSDKLRIEVEGDGEIISARPILEKRDAININAIVQNNQAYIGFDFLDYGDGGIFEIYHTGSADIPLKLNGTIKSASRIKIAEYENDYLFVTVTKPLFGWMKSLNLEKDSLTGTALVIILLPFVAPFIFTLTPIDKILSFFYSVPKEYNLSGIDAPNKMLNPTK